MSLVFRTRTWVTPQQPVHLWAEDTDTCRKLAQATFLLEGPHAEVIGLDKLEDATAEIMLAFHHHLLLNSARHGLHRLWGDVSPKLGQHLAETYGWSLVGTTDEGRCRVEYRVENAEV